jgi:hypothetical protein
MYKSTIVKGHTSVNSSFLTISCNLIKSYFISKTIIDFFPMFKVLAKADNRLLYDRMNNEELGVIDMLTFESAVKVGGRQKY